MFCRVSRNLHSLVITRFFQSINLANLSETERIKTLRNMARPKCRENPVIMTLDTPEFKSVITEEVNILANLFKNYGYEIRIAGGAVRDLLMNIEPKDLDFATTATPSQMKDIFTKENIRMINMKGEKHGTITPRINDKVNFEVTTLRIDVITDGRHAEVQFTTDWMLDALRRDLTINSMFLGLDGLLYDYFYGYEDLKQRRVAFVGDAVTRIKEDYLRILRYFRFYGRISEKSNCHEKETLTAIRNHASGLAQVSGERIWTELKKIAEGNFAGDLLQTIIECDLATYIGLPENCNVEELRKVWQRSGHLQMNAITLISSLLNTLDDAVALNDRLKLSAYERELALFVVEHRGPKPHSKPLMPYQQLILKNNKPSNAKEWAIEVLKYNNSPYLRELEEWQIPKFPVSGNMLKEKGVESGRFMGVVLNELKHYWADKGFDISPEEILKQLPIVLETLAANKKNKQAKK